MTDSLRYHPDFLSAFLPHRRPVIVALPPGYDHDPGRRYPVLYLNDGQNLFDPATAFAGVAWHADEAASAAARDGRSAPVILVGVANTPDREREYGPTPDDELARRYGRFLVEELRPFIDTTYRTRTGPADTGVGGSSLGGLIALHLTRWYPDVFGRCAALSPSLWWDKEAFLRAAANDPDWPGRCRIWLDMGEAEGVNNVRRTRRLARLLRSRGADFHYLQVPDGEHNEAAWGSRFGRVLEFLFPSAEGASDPLESLGGPE
jgi:predicted alpha/beta superfamily hydrolase